MTALIIVLIISICLCTFLLWNSYKKIYILEQENSKVIARNSATEKENAEIEYNNKKLYVENKNLTYQNDNLKELIEGHTIELRNKIQEQENILAKNKQVSADAFNNFWLVLENDYEQKSLEYDTKVEALNKSFEKTMNEFNKDLQQTQAELAKIKATYAATIEAERRSRDIEENLSDFCIQISDNDKLDIARLMQIRPSLHNGRVLSMLIWQTFFQKPLKSLSANILGASVKTGIYKITNIQTKECYIGQAVDVAKRWNEHAKCGLGIDTPAGNKLYKAMEEQGLYNFSFELLEECPKELLNEKERFYIDLYQSVDYGYNSSKGVGVK